MSDSHTPAVSSIDFSDFRPAIRDAIADSLAKITYIQNDEVPLTAERFARIERQTWEACMDLGRRVLQEVLEDRDARLPEDGLDAAGARDLQAGASRVGPSLLKFLFYNSAE